MGNPVFQWRRFWYPRNSEPRFRDEDFLTDPDEYGQFHPKTNLVHSLETLTNRCVVFLGEPSSGKSRTIGTEGIDRAAIERHIRQSGDNVSWIDLRGFDNSAGVAAAFASDSAIRSWVASPKQKLHLFLDSLDECRLSIPVISHVLLYEFRQLDIERLCLRIACRTAEWPTFLELELQKMYREEIPVLQLAPLREKDVVEAARSFGVDPEIFLSKMRELGATPFARKPPTLLSLLQLFSKGKPLPTSQWELYESQCRALCEEYNLSRVAAHKVSSFSADQLLEITSRLAAVSVFTNRPTFRCDSAPDPESPSALGKSELTGGEEYVGGIPIPVGEPAISQALETAFFVAAGRGLLRWETRTVAEFLA